MTHRPLVHAVQPLRFLQVLRPLGPLQVCNDVSIALLLVLLVPCRDSTELAPVTGQALAPVIRWVGVTACQDPSIDILDQRGTSWTVISDHCLCFKVSNG